MNIRLVCRAMSVAISKPRVAASGRPLPNARLVSYTVHPDMDKPDFVHTLMLMLFGQFLDHDMSRTAISKIAANDKGPFSPFSAFLSSACLWCMASRYI